MKADAHQEVRLFNLEDSMALGVSVRQVAMAVFIASR
jgi:hypothetical protein